MKKSLLPILFLLFQLNLYAQNVERCGTMEADSALRQAQGLPPLEDFENWLQAKIAVYKAYGEYQAGLRNVITIPIIFHIIHNGDAVGSNENISQAQVNSQIDVLNEDFRKALGTPGYNTNAVGADVELEFCPAVIDPNGNILAQPGIDRQNRNAASWQQSDIDATLKPATIWDPNRYCNVWVVNFGGSSTSLLGYAQFPSGSGLQGLGGTSGSTTDGVVVRYTACGRVGTVTSPYNKGRTLTHELGHWLGLRHIWGDQSCGNDFCNDTPTSTGANYGCATGQNTCNEGGANPPDMVENYMDYSSDVCMNIFTNDQKTRITTVMNASPRRLQLQSSNVCSIPFTFSYTGKVVDAVTSQGIPNAKVLMDGPADYNVTTDANGNFTIANLQQDNYTIYAGKWGYVTNSNASTAFTPTTPLITLSLQPGYYDDFTFDEAWVRTGNAVSGLWVRGVPVGTTFTSNNVTFQSNPGADVTADFFNRAYITGNGGGQAGTDDVDDGSTIITSPAMDLTGYTNPIVRYYRWFFNSGGSGNPNDSLIVSLQDGNTLIDIDRVAAAANTNQWTYKSYRVKDFIPNPSNNVKVIFRTFDVASTGHLVEAGLDLFRVIDSSGTNAVAPTVNFAPSNTNICAGQQITFNDLSSNNPTSWNWSFPGGSPSVASNANPVVTYSNPGTYAVTLLAGNGGGTGTLTQTALITVNAVVANFTQDVTSVCPGFSVTFANESSCSPTTIDWIFDGGDITTSTDQAPTVTYVSPGYYDVTLIAGNNSGKDTLVQNLAVQVYSTASVNAVSTDDNGNNSGTATATPVGGTPPFTFKWNDPQQQTTATATNLAAGTYNVTVTDANGCRSISSVTVLFSEPSAIDGFAKLGWSVFPNPATQVINILLDRSAEVEIYNALGQLVLSQKDMLKGLNVLEIGKWPHGVYSIKVKAGEQMAVQKVIIH